MDPITQGALGAIVAQVTTGKRLKKSSALIGALSGMAPDLDILIRGSDPLTPLIYHRHFTHSLSFVPVGALVCALVFWVLFRNIGKTYGFKNIYLASFAGYATHGLLDAFTTYGTMLYWPFSNTRVSWDLISIIDPFYTGMLLIGVFFYLFSKHKKVTTVFLLLSCFYIGFGGYQKTLVSKAQEAMAQKRGVQIVKHRIVPVMLSMTLWRGIFQDQMGHYHADSYYVPLFGDLKVKMGESLVLKNNSLPLSEQQQAAIQIWQWFTQGWYFWNEDNQMGDLRISRDPSRFESLWFLIFNPDGSYHRTRNFKERPENWAEELMQQVTGEDSDYKYLNSFE